MPNANANATDPVMDIYVLEGCPYCARALHVLSRFRLPTRVHVVDPRQKDKIKKAHGMNTFPQIFMTKAKKSYKIGGCEELETMIDVAHRLTNHRVNIQAIEFLIDYMQKQRKKNKKNKISSFKPANMRNSSGSAN